MPKSITVTLPDGSLHIYDGVPDNVTQEQAQARADQEFGTRTVQASSPNAAIINERRRLQDAAAMTHTGGSTHPVRERLPTPFVVDKSTGKVRPLTNIEKLTYGFGFGARNIGLNAAEMLGLTSAERVKEAQAEGAPITGKFPGNVGSFVGETAALAPIGMGVAGTVVKRLGMLPRGVLAGISEGMVQGAVGAGPDNRLEGMTFGAATGGALPTGARMLQLLGRGMPMTTNARRLVRRGVGLTPGQMNPDGSVAMVEELLQGVPGIGTRIKNARAQGWQQTQNLIAQEAAPPGFKPQPRNDQNAMFRDLMEAYKKAYEVGKGYPMLPVIRPDRGPDVPLTKALQVPRGAVATDEGRAYAAKFLNNELSIIRELGAKLKSDDLLDVRSRIRAKVRDLKSSPNTLVGADDILENAEKKITAALDSQLPTGVKDQIRAIDAKYGNFKVVQNALERAKDRPEGFTPAQFSQAVHAGTTPGMGYAAGGGRMRDISKAASDVFQPRQPMTGRQLAGLLATGAGAFGAGYVAPVATGVALGAGALPYLPRTIGQTARQVARGQTPVQQAIRQAERNVRRALTPQERESIVRFLQTAGIAAQNEQEQQ